MRESLFIWMMLICVWSTSTTAFAQENMFFSIVPDLPIIPGFIEIADRGVFFDGPDGRYNEVYAYGTLAHRQVTQFYDETLPQMGWRKTGEKIFYRDGENLILTVEKIGDLTMLKLIIIPQS